MYSILKLYSTRMKLNRITTKKCVIIWTIIYAVFDWSLRSHEMACLVTWFITFELFSVELFKIEDVWGSTCFNFDLFLKITNACRSINISVFEKAESLNLCLEVQNRHFQYLFSWISRHFVFFEDFDLIFQGNKVLT